MDSRTCVACGDLREDGPTQRSRHERFTVVRDDMHLSIMITICVIAACGDERFTSNKSPSRNGRIQKIFGYKRLHYFWSANTVILLVTAKPASTDDCA